MPPNVCVCASACVSVRVCCSAESARPHAPFCALRFVYRIHRSATPNNSRVRGAMQLQEEAR
eukprot:8312586-Alexandrium_andersonii.AAC.1